ncbi:hypothetical protein [Streptomyces cathayae]|uniref:Uncharacterized protein n=1 Tax=Streptomyces cathayae TaxID=3031124 RepID=A0ABY8K180_9ACTN|nr:hypothetical protein [Streptomyces sp. HUAS 5]WGD40646.1 hypothetical protein PYS65_11090 [Streptomyces sp. HUAS 5]
MLGERVAAYLEDLTGPRLTNGGWEIVSLGVTPEYDYLPVKHHPAPLASVGAVSAETVQRHIGTQKERPGRRRRGGS